MVCTLHGICSEWLSLQDFGGQMIVGMPSELYWVKLSETVN